MKTKNDIQQLALDAIKTKRRSTIAMSVGSGKTLVGIYHMEQELYNNINSKFLIVIPKLSVKNTWIDESIKHEKEHLTKHMSFTTYRSLIKCSLDYTALYLDEIHNLKYSHSTWLSQFKGRILGLTGSPPRNSKSEKARMLTAFAPIVYEYITDEAIDDRILNDYIIYVHSLELDKVKNISNKTKTGSIFMSSELDTYNYWTKRIEQAYGNPGLEKICRLMRMKSMQGFKSKETKTKQLVTLIDDKCLIFCNTTEQADRLCEHVYHSKNKDNEANLEAFKKGEIKLLASVAQLKEGINIPGLKASIILHSFASEYVTKQKIGRLLRLPVEEVAVVHLLMYKNTVDEEWVKKALQDYNFKKIIYL